ncbi:MAG: hypothetical protein ACKO7W_01660 [Elainella sp.]
MASGYLATAPPEATFFALFPHRFDYIYAPHSAKPDWQTERRHPLTDRLLQQGSYLYGVRFGAATQYGLLDIDAGSLYHPSRDPWAIGRIVAALEPLGLVSYLVCTSSYSDGLHLYLPFDTAQPSWQIGTALTVLLENAGFLIKPGQLEVFPNRRHYSVQGSPNLFNAHRLPLQIGSYLLNASFEPVWVDRHKFVEQWRHVQSRNQLSEKSLGQILKQNQRRQYRVSGRAAKFLNDLNAEIELGWTGSGQTNYLLGRITLRTYVFHHILTGEPPLTGQALVEEVSRIARELPGYQDWCQHQHELGDRVREWVSCVENSRYFHYGISKETQFKQELESKNINQENPAGDGLSWNQKQCQSARQRIQIAVADLLDRGKLPNSTTARFKALAEYGIGGSSLYKHKDLWHPDLISTSPATVQLGETLDQAHPEESTVTDQDHPESSIVNLVNPNPFHSDNSFTSFISLFVDLGRNFFAALNSSYLNTGYSSSAGCNCLVEASSADSPLGLPANLPVNLPMKLQSFKPLLDWHLSGHLNGYLNQLVFKPP